MLIIISYYLLSYDEDVFHVSEEISEVVVVMWPLLLMDLLGLVYSLISSAEAASLNAKIDRTYQGTWVT